MLRLYTTVALFEWFRYNSSFLPESFVPNIMRKTKANFFDFQNFMALFEVFKKLFIGALKTSEKNEIKKHSFFRAKKKYVQR